MSRVITEDKRTGIKYVYEQVSVWSPEHKQARPKKTLIGKIDPETGEIVPTDGRGRKRRRKTDAADLPVKDETTGTGKTAAETDMKMKKEILRLEQELYLLEALVKEQEEQIRRLLSENTKLNEKLVQLTDAINRLAQ